MPIIVTEPGPDGTLQTVAEPPAPDAAPPPGEAGDPGASAPPPVPPAAPEPPAPAPPASAPDVPQATETTEDDEDEAPEPVPRGVQRKIDREVRRRHDAERKAAAIEARLQMLEQGYQRAPQESEPVPLHQQPEPKNVDYASEEEFDAARWEWRKAQWKQELAREAYQAQAMQRQAEQQARMQAQAQEARQKYADFDQVLDRLQTLPTVPALEACVHESELGAELAYYLAQHPDEIQHLNQMAQTQPLAMAREIGKLEVRLASPTNGTSPPGSVSGAGTSRPPSPPLPAPVTPLSGAGSPGTAEPDWNNMSQREFEQWWKRTYPGVR